MDSDLRTTAAILGFALCCSAPAQLSACGTHMITEQAGAVYPPIARAAHVTGTVILLMKFDHDGAASDVQAVSGPEMLKQSALAFVQEWHGEPSSGSRGCYVFVSYALDGDSGCGIGSGVPPTPPAEQTGRKDAQHYTVIAENLLLCDPAVTVKIRRRFLHTF